MSDKQPKTMDADQFLIEKICQQDKQALDTLYQKHHEKMLGLAYQMLGQITDAEDIIHDVFIEIWHKASSYNSSKATVFGWLMLRVRSRCLDKIRKTQTQKKYVQKQEIEQEFQANSATDTYIDNKLLNKTLNILSTKQRFIIEMSYFKGLSCSEISHYYGIPLGTVKTRLLSAMNKMKKLQSQHNEKLL